MSRSAYNYRIDCDDATGWQFSWHNDANERNIFMGCYLYIGSRLVSQRTIKVWSSIFRSRMIDPLRVRHILPWMRRILRVLWLRIHVRHKTVRPLSNRPSVIRPKRSTSRRSTATQTWPTSACNVNNGRNLKFNYSRLWNWIDTYHQRVHLCTSSSWFDLGSRCDDHVLRELSSFIAPDTSRCWWQFQSHQHRQQVIQKALYLVASNKVYILFLVAVFFR